MLRQALPLALLTLALPACRSFEDLADPTVVVETRAGSELGVSTEYGVVFLGSTADSGEATVIAWFGDGPSIEPALIEPLGPNLYVLNTEIRLPTAQLSYADPAHGTPVVVRGRSSAGAWVETTRVVRDDRIDGFLLEPIARLSGATDQTGAGVFLPGGTGDSELIGLVSGRLRFEDSGDPTEYLAVVGPTSLWRLVTYRRDVQEERPPVLRPDVL